MTITDQQVAVLRAQISAPNDESDVDELLSKLDLDGPTWADRDGYTKLLTVASFRAVKRRFSGRGTRVSDIVSYVGDLRSRSERIAHGLDPVATEHFIRFALGDENVSIEDMDGPTRMGVMIVVLAGLIGDEQLDQAGIDQFIAEVRAEADEWVGESADG